MLTFEQGRVLGAMVEKAMTTPDNYPMSLNAVVTACNQVSNRDPIVSFDEGRVEMVLRELADRGLAKMVHRPGDRVVKYRHALDADLEVGDEQIALLAILLLRDAQTPGELRQRSQRYVDFASLPEVESTLEELRRRDPPLVARLERRPGQKEHRYRHLLFTDDVIEPGDEPTPVVATGPYVAQPPPSAESSSEPSPPPGDGDLHQEVAELRAEVAELRRRLERVAGELGID